MRGQAEPKFTLDVDGGALEVPVNVPVEEGVADESALVLPSVSLACVSLGFKSDGEGLFGSLGPLEPSPYVVSMLL